MSPRSSRATRLTVIAIVVGALLLAALIDRSGADDETTQAVMTGPRVPSADAIETAWYCAEGTSNPNGRADERIHIANVDRRDGRARVSVMSGPDNEPRVLDVDLAAGTLVNLRVADVLAVPDPGVLVEVSGARAVVSHSITGNRDAGVGPCARDAAPQWHFAAATTARGAQLFLALFNPFSDDAIVDISFLTASGPLEPEDVQGFVVPGHSRVTVPVHDYARRDAVVSTEVASRRGRVIAEQTQTLDGTDGRRGLALSLGATQASRRWEWASGSVANGRTQTLVIANPQRTPTSATIRTRLDGGALEPETVSIPARSAVAVDVGRRVPAGIGFSIRVDGELPVVAESLVAQREPIPSAQRGIATEIGSTKPARFWVDVPARATGRSQDAVAIANPGRAGVDVRLRIVGGGETTAPPRLQRIRLAPGRRTVVDLVDLQVRADAFVTIDASGPVVVDRASAGMPGITEATAIPDYDR